jgi:hypothetical protein
MVDHRAILNADTIRASVGRVPVEFGAHPST